MDNKVKYCPKCGQQLGLEVRFCTRCGQKLVFDEPEEIIEEPVQEIIEEEVVKETRVSKKSKGSNKAIIIALVVVLLTAAGIGGYFLLQSGKKSTTPAETTTQETKQEETTQEEKKEETQEEVKKIITVPSDSIVVSFSGTTGSGVVKNSYIDVDKVDTYNNEIKKFLDEVNVKVSKKKSLSNGDTVTVTLDFDTLKANELGVEFEKTSIQKKVSGLNKITYTYSMSDYQTRFSEFYLYEYLPAINNGDLSTITHVTSNVKSSITRRYNKYNSPHVYTNEYVKFDSTSFYRTKSGPTETGTFYVVMRNWYADGTKSTKLTMKIQMKIYKSGNYDVITYQTKKDSITNGHKLVTIG